VWQTDRQTDILLANAALDYIALPKTEHFLSNSTLILEYTISFRDVIVLYKRIVLSTLTLNFDSVASIQGAPVARPEQYYWLQAQ